MHILTLVLSILASVPPPHASDAAATVGGVTITRAELERAAASKLLRVHSEAYEVRRALIERRVAEILLQQRASAEKLQSAEWLAREVAKRRRPPTPQEVEAAYETLTGDLRAKPKAEALAELERSMLAARGQAAEQEIRRELRNAADVQFRLEPPRLDRHDVGGAVVHGPDDARVTMVILQDFQCPRCASLAPVFAELREHFPEKLRMIHRDFPLANHPQAKAAAEAAACAAEQNRFWEIADELYAHQDALNRASFIGLAVEKGLDREEFTACLDSGRQQRSWKDGLAVARELGLRGTPAVLINGRLIVGARDFETYALIIEEEIGTDF